MYKVSSSSYRIYKVKVTKFTDNSVWVQDDFGVSRVAMHSVFNDYFHTAKEAKKFALDNLKDAISSLKAEIASHKETIAYNKVKF